MSAAPAITQREVRAWCYISQLYLQRVIATTPVPHVERFERIVRDLQEVVLSLRPDEPSVPGLD